MREISTQIQIWTYLLRNRQFAFKSGIISASKPNMIIINGFQTIFIDFGSLSFFGLKSRSYRNRVDLIINIDFLLIIFIVQIWSFLNFERIINLSSISRSYGYGFCSDIILVFFLCRQGKACQYQKIG